jgi:hypothetical protein
MTILCNSFDDLLLEGDEFSMSIAAEHAAGCETCAEKLASWNEISDTARDLHVTWENEMLWPRIERAIRNERQHSRMRVWQIAAAFLIFAVVGGLAWRAYQRTQTAAFGQSILTSEAVDQVEAAEKTHIAAIDHLEKVVKPKLEDPSSPLLVSYKEKLMLLDDAIAECQANIDRNRQNAHLRRQLLAIYTEKQQTLQQVLREGSHVSNQNQ